ncbi:hypothetical protein [Aquimarina amphilecti]|nr:hypothetical protein [Aquimarina amphilecti]
MIHKKLSEAYKSANYLEKAGLSDKKSRILSNAARIKNHIKIL